MKYTVLLIALLWAFVGRSQGLSLYLIVIYSHISNEWEHYHQYVIIDLSRYSWLDNVACIIFEYIVSKALSTNCFQAPLSPVGRWDCTSVRSARTRTSSAKAVPQDTP